LVHLFSIRNMDKKSNILLATGGYDHKICFWDAVSGELGSRYIKYPDSQINKLEFTPTKQYIAAAGNLHIRLFEVELMNQNPVTSFDGHKTNVTSFGFHREGKWMYSGSEDGTIRIWDIRAPGCQTNFECGGPVNTVVLHPNQAELISGDQNGVIKVWDLVSNTCSRTLTPDEDIPIRSISISSDGSKVVAVNNSGNICVFKLAKKNTSTFDLIQKVDNAHKSYCLKASFSPNCKYFATTSADSSVKLWNSSDLSLHKNLLGHQKWVWDAVWSIDSSLIVTGGSDKTARLWEVSTGEQLRTYTGHDTAIISMALNDSEFKKKE